MLTNLQNKHIILASKSPRRQELLKGLDLSFEIRTKDVEETYPPTIEAKDVPAFLAEKKANAFNENLADHEIIITSDTIVICDDQILEKPQSAEEAKAMIRQLSGNTHTVVTGVCVQSKTKTEIFSDATRVKFARLDPSEIDYYVTQYQPFDKAGAYGVQEWIGYIGIERLEGSYYTVMGLPVHKLYTVLKSF